MGIVEGVGERGRRELRGRRERIGGLGEGVGERG